MKLSRRNYIQSSVAGLVGAVALPLAAKTTKKLQNPKGCFILTELLNAPQSNDVTISKQVGITNVIASGGLGRARKEDYVAAV